MTSTRDLIAAFGSVEDDQRYTRLVDSFAEQAVYYDPFFGPQVGKPAIHDFMTHMETVVPASGVRFDDWRVTAGENCGYAEWNMVAPGADGHEVWVPGESLYRLVDGQVLGVVDYVDPVAYNKLRGDSARIPDFVGAGGALPVATAPGAQSATTLEQHVSAITYAGRWPGSAELVDHAGDSGVGWAQWIFHGPNGDFAGWSLLRLDGHVRDYFDTVTAHHQAS